jgi:hypothetical protein
MQQYEFLTSLLMWLFTVSEDVVTVFPKMILARRNSRDCIVIISFKISAAHAQGLLLI